MTTDSDLVYFQMQMLQCEIELQGMIAENKRRDCFGEPFKYSEKDFINLIDKYGIHHNKFPFRKG